MHSRVMDPEVAEASPEDLMIVVEQLVRSVRARATTDSGLEIFRWRRAQHTEALRELVMELTGPEQHTVKVALPALARAIRQRQARS
ncbi:hypothetical protein [Streptomyces chiangmaiensis]|uniref:Uncharacterized protein n=2 Tax=Streptomyces chiangmaiensis TaxID=766497 RepID=A0ABU7FEG1_9ACTN|nr:hypothetical protein [Streptomyces chiangmaiensis]MED7821733.1 hypothetical protein [Streptomyces chiangmaiensis]